METFDYLKLVLGLLSLLCYSIFIGAERLFISVSKTTMKKLKDDGIRGASKMLIITGNKKRFLITLTLGEILTVLVGTALSLNIISHFQVSGIPYTTVWTFILLVFTVLVFFVFGQIFSKILAPDDYEKSVSRLSFVLWVFYYVFLPITMATDLLLRSLFPNSKTLEQKEEALMDLVESESEEGTIEVEEKNMIQGVLAFADTSVKEVMVPRIDVVAADISIELTRLVELFHECGHSRIPVYQNTVDDIKGIVFAKDLLEFVIKEKTFRIEKVMREPYFIPENKKINDLLAEFKLNKNHLAIVVDEYGGTAGIATMEDILEEIVGEIQDEYDNEAEIYQWIDGKTLEVDGRIDIHDLNEIMGIGIPDEDFETLAGFIYDRMGSIPKIGDSLNSDKTHIEIIGLDGHRIERVRLTYLRPEEHTAEED